MTLGEQNPLRFARHAVNRIEIPVRGENKAPNLGPLKDHRPIRDQRYPLTYSVGMPTSNSTSWAIERHSASVFSAMHEAMRKLSIDDRRLYYSLTFTPRQKAT